MMLLKEVKTAWPGYEEEHFEKWRHAQSQPIDRITFLDELTTKKITYIKDAKINDHYSRIFYFSDDTAIATDVSDGSGRVFWKVTIPKRRRL